MPHHIAWASGYRYLGCPEMIQTLKPKNSEWNPRGKSHRGSRIPYCGWKWPAKCSSSHLIRAQDSSDMPTGAGFASPLLQQVPC